MPKLPLNQILCGNCIEILKDFPDNSIDLVVTDPPYGLSFMGKDWDKTLPPREAFEEIIRVLKPGALTFVMSSPRQDLLWRMLSLLEGVGFELNQSYIEWIYKTGFPKAYDVSNGIDKKNGLNREILGPYPAMTGQKYKWGKKGIYGEDKNPQNMVLTSPTSDMAKKWDGWKSQTGLKPAHEPILMVNKPFSESTIVDNVLKWGTGAINVDACRIPFKNEADLEGRKRGVLKSPPLGRSGIYGHMEEVDTDKYISQKGRFPANLLVSDKAIDTGKLTRSFGGSGEKTLESIDRTDIGYGFKRIENPPGLGGYGDVGDQSRYFDLDAWAEHHGFLDVAKPSKSERDFGLKGFPLKMRSEANKMMGDSQEMKMGSGKDRTIKFRNVHPTVKPIKLMAYLIELGCPPDGVVLDPFVGSGTTCIAAKKLVRKFIGIEINPEYHALANARLKAYPVPMSWFARAKGES